MIHQHKDIILFRQTCKRCSPILNVVINLETLTLCMLGNFSCLCCCLLTFFKINFFKNSFRNINRVSYSLDRDQDLRSVGPDLGPKCLQRLSA